MTPSPATPAEVGERVSADLERLFADQPPIDTALTVYDAMARAVVFNLEHRVEAMQKALAYRQFDLAHFSLLPTMTGDTGYLARNPDNISSADSLRRWRSNLAFTWNLLDFGVSFLRARQQADRVLIAEEVRRRTIQTLIRQVTETYWQAAAALDVNRMLPDLRRLIDEGLATVRREAEQRLRPDSELLPLERRLLELANQLLAAEREAETRRSDLAMMINARPGTPLPLAVSEETWRTPVPDRRRLPGMTRLQTVALTQRAELRQEDYEERIGNNEINIAFLRFLPGLELTASADNENNNAILWSEIGGRILANINDLVSGPARVAAAETQADLARTRRLAVSLSVLTQVHLAHAQLTFAMDGLALAEALESVARRQWTTDRDLVAVGVESPVLLIQRQAELFLAETRRKRAYADAQAAWAGLHASLGLHPLPNTVPDTSLPRLAATLEASMSSWQQHLGTLSVLTPDIRTTPMADAIGRPKSADTAVITRGG